MSKQGVSLIFVTVGLIALSLVMGAVLAGCGGASQPTQPQPGVTVGPTQPGTIDAASLLDERCSSCHPSTRAKTAHHTQAEWEQTVTRMIGHGAQLSDAEKAALVDYLAKNFP